MSTEKPSATKQVEDEASLRARNPNAFAENCAQLAERASDDPTHRRYKRMEAAWRALAENRIGWTGKYLLHAQMANRFPRAAGITACSARITIHRQIGRRGRTARLISPPSGRWQGKTKTPTAWHTGRFSCRATAGQLRHYCRPRRQAAAISQNENLTNTIAAVI